MSANASFLVSVIVPCYNLGNYLTECLQSILLQSYENIEVLIMDDASMDNTSEVGQFFEKKDSRVKYIRNEHNLGHLENYSKGINLCRGEYIYLISADDKMLPECIEKMMTLFKRDPQTGFVFSPCIIERDGKLYQGFGYSELSTGIYNGPDMFMRILSLTCLVPMCSVMTRSECFKTLGQFSPHYPHSADFDMWLRIAKQYKVGYVREPLVIYRIHPFNMHKQKAKAREIEKDVLSILDTTAKDLAPSLKKKVYFRHCCLLVKNYLAVLNGASALRWLIKGFTVYPLWFFHAEEYKFLFKMVVETLKKRFVRIQRSEP